MVLQTHLQYNGMSKIHGSACSMCEGPGSKKRTRIYQHNQEVIPTKQESKSCAMVFARMQLKCVINCNVDE